MKQNDSNQNVQDSTCEPQLGYYVCSFVCMMRNGQNNHKTL